MNPSTRKPHHAHTSGRHLFAALPAVLLAVTLVAACGPATDPGGEAADGGAEGTSGVAAGEGVGNSGGDTFATLTEVQRFAPPADPGAMAPQLSPAREGGVWMSWLEPIGVGPGSGGDSEAGGNPGHRLRVARFDGTAWGPARTVAQGSDFFANWADVPSVVEGEDGELLAHWLAKISDDTYAYGVFLARSGDGGETWSELGTLHDDASPTEHGFVSLLAAPGGGFDAAWLDGRGMADGGPMTVRAAHVVPGATSRDDVEKLGVLDERVCECCQTGAAQTPDGPLVAYRDRSQGEVRDVYTVRRAGDGWSAPVPVADDGWTIAGCPVNGPAVATAGERAFLAWFTAGGGKPRVRAAFSDDAGASFGTAVEVDAEDAAPGRPAPLGRVDAVLVEARDGAARNGDPASAVVSWLGGDGGVWLRRVSPSPGSAGPASAGVTLHPARRVARTATARASGFPRVEALVEPGAGQGANPRLAVAWVEPGEGNGDQASEGGVRFATLDLSTLPLADRPTPPVGDR